MLWTALFSFHDSHWHRRANQQTELLRFLCILVYICQIFSNKHLLAFYISICWPLHLVLALIALSTLSFSSPIVTPAEGNWIPLKDQYSFYLLDLRCIVSLLHSKEGLCVFIEQLCLVTPQQVSHHLRGRPACHASSLPFIHLSAPRLPPPQFFSTPCWVSIGFRPNRQTNRTTTKKKTITRTRLVWALARDGERSCLLSGPVPFHCDGREGLPGHGYTQTSV